MRFVVLRSRNALPLCPHLHPHFFYSPHRGSLVDGHNDVFFCHGNGRVDGREQGFWALLQPGKRVSITQKTETFSHEHALWWDGDDFYHPSDGEPCCKDYDLAGDCEENADWNENVLWNTGTVALKVYIIIEEITERNDDSILDFELEWVIDTPGMLSCFLMMLLLASIF